MLILKCLKSLSKALYSCMVGNVRTSMWIKASLCSITASLSVSWGNCHSTEFLHYYTDIASLLTKQWGFLMCWINITVRFLPIVHILHLQKFIEMKQKASERQTHTSTGTQTHSFLLNQPTHKSVKHFPCFLFICLFQQAPLHLFVSGCLHFPPVIRRRAALFPLVTMEMRSTCKYLSTLAKAAR